MSVKIYQCLAMLFLVLLVGCYPKGPEYAEELQLVYTNYSKEYNFASATTYAIPDSVILITGEAFVDGDGNKRPQMLAAAKGDVILKQIKDNLNAMGWTRVDKNNNPDVLVLTSVMTTTTIYYYYDYWYWDWWYGGYWGWYYPGYYPPVVTGYTSGSVFTQMVDGTPKPAGDNLPVVWSSIVNGLAEGSTADITARVKTGIDKAFVQSPYLKH